MRALSRVLSALCLLGALQMPATGAAVAETQPLADLDPLDPASCDHEDGLVVVAVAWNNAWHQADQAGLLEEPRATELAIWYTAMQNYLIESNDVKGTCLALIESRKVHRF